MKRTKSTKEYLNKFHTVYPLIIYYGTEGSDFARYILENNLFDVYGAPTFDIGDEK